MLMSRSLRRRMVVAWGSWMRVGGCRSRRQRSRVSKRRSGRYAVGTVQRGLACCVGESSICDRSRTVDRRALVRDAARRGGGKKSHDCRRQTLKHAISICRVDVVQWDHLIRGHE